MTDANSLARWYVSMQLLLVTVSSELHQLQIDKRDAMHGIAY